jgi:hypothetical protein
MKDLFLDAVSDTLKLIPFLFVTYALMEILERKTSAAQTRTLARMGRLGPVFGALVGVVPQCGFSVAAADLYASGLLTAGTLLAVFLSTSDEMLPMLISSQIPASRIIKILLWKVVLGMLTGLLIDLLLKPKPKAKPVPSALDEETDSILSAALKHTLQIAAFVFGISLILSYLVNTFGRSVILSFLSEKTIIGVLVTALVGLIPNCGASVALTQLYLDGLLNGGQMMAGLLVSAGAGLLVLYRTNRDMKENLILTFLLYAISALWGLLIEILQITF